MAHQIRWKRIREKKIVAETIEGIEIVMKRKITVEDVLIFLNKLMGALGFILLLCGASATSNDIVKGSIVALVGILLMVASFKLGGLWYEG